MPYSPKCIDFAPILPYTHPVSLKCLSAGAKFWVLYLFRGENIGNLTNSSAYYPHPTTPAPPDGSIPVRKVPYKCVFFLLRLKQMSIIFIF